MSDTTAGEFANYEMMGATLLAAQPPKLKSLVDEQTDADWNVIFTQLESRLGMLRTWRYSWWAYWNQLALYTLPRRYHWLVVANLMRRGAPVNDAIIDSTATLAMEICAAGMVEGLMPTTRPWFKLGVGIPGTEPDAAAKEWLEDTEERGYAVLAQSNFYTIMAQAAQDQVTFGTAPVIMYEDAEDVIRCYAPCAGEYYLAAGSRFSIDSLYREFTLTVAQIVEMFGLEQCPSDVRALWETGGASWEMERVVAHAIEPNADMSDRSGGKIRVVKGFPFRELYWLKGMQTPRELSRRGFHERPFAVARWSTVSNDAYGRGPGMDALGDIKQLQLETRRKAEAIEKQVRPPMGAHPSLKNEPSSINPGHITYADTTNGKPGFWPLFEVKPDLVGMAADLKEIQSRIDRCFLVDVFMAITQMEGVQPRNEIEIAERKAEKLQRLGPVIGLWKTEFASPLIQRLIGILHRRNMLKPMPPSLRGVPLKIEYIDMVTLAQLGAETASMERVFATAGSLSEAAKAAQVPDPIRVLNLDASMRKYSDKLNFPADCVFTKDEVAQHDAARAQVQQGQQTQQAATTALPAMVDAAHGLSQTPIGGGQSALSALIGGAGGGGPSGVPAAGP